MGVRGNLGLLIKVYLKSKVGGSYFFTIVTKSYYCHQILLLSCCDHSFVPYNFRQRTVLLYHQMLLLSVLQLISEFRSYRGLLGGCKSEAGILSLLERRSISHLIARVEFAIGCRRSFWLSICLWNEILRGDLYGYNHIMEECSECSCSVGLCMHVGVVTLWHAL